MAASLFPVTTSRASYLSPTTATIDLSALAHNLAELRRFIAPRCEILAIVKADGYGHGSLVIAETLAQLGINKFGVATIQEGVSLREAGLTGRIIVLGGIFPTQIRDLLQHHLTPVISSLDIAQQLGEAVSANQAPLPVHVKVDTGMNRLGLSPEALPTLLESTPFRGPLVLEGLMTHLPDADNPDPAFTFNQLTKFSTLTQELQLQGHSIPFRHVANTAGVILHLQSHFDMVRPGLLLYGYAPSHRTPLPLDLKPILKLSTQIVQTKTVPPGEPLSYNGSFRTTRLTRIGILPIGYAHGYNRLLSNRGEVLVQNTRVPIVGKICMDMTLIDITEVPEAQAESEVMLIGSQGEETITAEDLAIWQESIPYEVLCSIGPRVNRVYEPVA